MHWYHVLCWNTVIVQCCGHHMTNLRRLESVFIILSVTVMLRTASCQIKLWQSWGNRLPPRWTPWVQRLEQQSCGCCISAVWKLWHYSFELNGLVTSDFICIQFLNCWICLQRLDMPTMQSQGDCFYSCSATWKKDMSGCTACLMTMATTLSGGMIEVIVVQKSTTSMMTSDWSSILRAQSVRLSWSTMQDIIIIQAFNYSSQLFILNEMCFSVNGQIFSVNRHTHL